MTMTDENPRTLDVDGSRLTYTDSGGEGPTVLLVHAGVFGSWFDPLAEAPALEDLRVLNVRRAGYTGETATEVPLGIDGPAMHLAVLLDELEVRGAHVVAHSSSTAIVLQLALERPELVGSLVLSEPPLVDAFVDPEDRQLVGELVGPVIGAAIGSAAQGDVAAAFDAFMGAICGPAYPQVMVDALGPDAIDRALVDARFFFADEIMAVAAWTLDDVDAARVSVPVTVVQGGDSPPPVQRVVARLAGRLPDARTATIEGDDHLLPLRSTDRFAELIRDCVLS